MPQNKTYIHDIERVEINDAVAYNFTEIYISTILPYIISLS